MLSTIGRDVFAPVKISEQFEQAGRGHELVNWEPAPSGFLYLYNTPHVVNAHIANPETKIIINFRDPRDLACNQYHWVFQHPSNKSEQETADYRQKVHSAGIDQYVLNRDNGILFNSIRAVLHRIEAGDPNVLTVSYNQLCLDFDGMIQRIAEFLEVDAITIAWDQLELERTDNLKSNPNWIGQMWTGTDTLPGRYKRELKSETIRALDEKYRNDLRILRSIELPKFRHLLTTAAEEDEMNRVLVGESGYLFLTRDANDTLSQITGRKKLDQSEMYNIAFAHHARRIFGKTIVNFDYGHAVIPSKEVALKVFLPREVGFEEFGPRPIGQYLTAASSIWRPFYQPDLVETTSQEQPSYYPSSDSHWNHAGALRYLRGFLDSVDPSLSRALDQSEMRRFQATQQGDLGLKLEMKPEKIEIVAAKQSHAKLIFENRISNEGSVRWFKSPSRTGKRAVILHDSFAMWLFGFLAEIFDEVLFVHGTIFDFNFMQEFKPTTVLCLQAERFFVRVPETGADLLSFISRQEVQKKAEQTFLEAWKKRNPLEK